MSAPANLTDVQFRASVVGASEVSALFDANPWLTQYELFHRKTGSVAVPTFNEVVNGEPIDERIYFGVKLEPAILEAAYERWGYKPLAEPDRFDNGKGLGGHPDKIARDGSRSRVALEVKMVDWLVFKNWGGEPPLHYLLQSQACQGLAQCDFGDVIVLVGGNQLVRFQYDFRPVLYADMQARVVEFWRDVRAGKSPKPDYSRDGRTLGEVFNDPADTVIDLRRDNRMPEVLLEFIEARADEHAARCRVDAAKAEILHKLGNHTTALVDGFSCRAPLTAGSTDTIITPEMVGETIKGRAAHRRFYVKEKEIK